MTVVRHTEAPVFDTGGATITGLASPRRGATDTAAWRVRFAPDHPSPAHTIDREEVFIVLAGEVSAQFADRRETASAGDALIIPAGEEFTISAGDAPAEAVCLLPVGARATLNGQSITPPWAE